MSKTTRGTMILNWVAFLAVLVVNALANILPINGYNTGQISSLYPNYFVPAGFTFSIWGLIYLLLLLYTITLTFFSSHQPLSEHKAHAYFSSINGWYLLSCVLNIAWILCWHYLKAGASVVVMLLMLYSLLQVFLKGKDILKTFPLHLQFLLGAPFTVYLGWISVATIANITAYLVKSGWQGGPLDQDIWSAVMITIAIVLALFILLRFRVAGFALTVAWALWGIRASQGPGSELLLRISTAGVITLLVVVVIERIVTYFFTSNNFKSIGW